MSENKSSELRTAVCPLCDKFSSKRLTTLERHFNEEHSTTSKSVWDSINGGPKICACGCGRETKWNGWWNGYASIIKGHNVYATFSKEKAREISEKRKASLRGKPSWCKGLTKETDDRVKRRGDATSKGRTAAFDSGKITSWNKGLTKETDVRVADAAADLKKMYEDGTCAPWSKGLTKETDDRVKKMSERVAITTMQESLRKKLDSLKRLSHEEISSRIAASGSLKVVGGLDNYVNDYHKIIEVECTKCGNRSVGSLRNFQHGRCFSCHPGGFIAQEEIAAWIESLGLVVKRNDRTRLDSNLVLDIFVEDRSFGVEYNGLYWHSYVNKSSSYHSNKTKAAEKKGITLYHVFEDEWRDKREIVKSMIESKLGLTKNKIGARECTIREMTTQERKSFFQTNHIDGDVASVVAFCLTGQTGEIVYAISLRKPLHKRDGMIEVARCCSAIGFSVTGGLSRLIKFASLWSRENSYTKMMTYVDTRFGGSGDGYKKSGLKEVRRTEPRFWWTDFDDRHNRFKFRADPSQGLTESAVADREGVVKIYGCENIVLEVDL